MSTPYIPKVRAYVDWDGDGFINKGVPHGTPVNLIPYAPFPRACNLKKYDGSYTNRFLFDDRYALVSRDVSLDVGELAYFGSEYNDYYRPSENPSLINTTETTPLTITQNTNSDVEIDDEGLVSIRQVTSWVGTAYLGGSSALGAEIPVVNGQSYTFFYYRNTPRDATNNVAITIVDSTNTNIAVSNISNQTTAGWVALNFTAGANPVKIRFGNVVDMNITKFMLLDGTHATPPDGFNLWGAAPTKYQAPTIMEAGNSYAVSFVMTADADCEIDLTVFGQHYGEAGNEVDRKSVV